MSTKPRGPTAEMNRFLVAVDLLHDTEALMRWAAALAEATDGRLVLFTVVDPTHEVWAAITSPKAREQMQARLTAEAKDALTRLAHGTDSPVRERVEQRVVVRGRPAEQIVRAAVEHAVHGVIMGTRGRGAFADWVLGGVTDQVLRSAPCPVFVVPPARS